MKSVPRETPRSARRDLHDSSNADLAADRMASWLEIPSWHDASSILAHDTPASATRGTPVVAQSERPEAAPRESLDAGRRGMASDRLAQWLVDGLEGVKDEVPPPCSARHAIQYLAPAPLRRRSAGAHETPPQLLSRTPSMPKDARPLSQREHSEVIAGRKPSDSFLMGPASAAVATPRLPPPSIHKEGEEYMAASTRPKCTPVVWLGPDEGVRSFGCSDIEASLLSDRSPVSGRREGNGSLLSGRHSFGGRRDAAAQEHRVPVPRSASRGGFSSVPAPAAPAAPAGRFASGTPGLATPRHWQDLPPQRQSLDANTPRQWHTKPSGVQSMEALREAAGVADRRPGSAAAAASRLDPSQSLESFDGLLREAKAAKSAFQERSGSSEQLHLQRQASGPRASSLSGGVRTAASRQGGGAPVPRQVQAGGAHVADQTFTPRPAATSRSGSRRQLSHDELDFALPVPAQGRTAPPGGASMIGRTTRPEGQAGIRSTPRHESRKLPEDLGCIPGSAPPPRTGRNSVKDLLEAEQQWRTLQSSFNAALGFAAMSVGTPAQDHRLLQHAMSGHEAMWAAPRPFGGMCAGPVH